MSLRMIPKKREEQGMEKKLSLLCGSFFSVELLLFITTIIISFPRLVIDNDFWFYLSHGRYIMANGLYPGTDPFLIHEGFQMTFQRYATSLLFWNIYRLFAEKGIFLLLILSSYLTAYILYKQAMFVSNRNKQISLLTTTILMFCMKDLIVTRAQMFSTLLLGLSILCLEKYMADRKKRYLIPVSLSYFLIIQFHSSLWPMLSILAAPYFVELALEWKKDKDNGFKEFILSELTGIGSMILNPYGIKSIEYVFLAYGTKELEMISEMRAVSIKNMPETLFLLLVLVSLMCMRREWLIEKISGVTNIYEGNTNGIRYIFLIAGFGIFSLVSARNITMMAMCAGFIIAFFLKDYRFGKLSVLRMGLILTAFMVIEICLLKPSVTCFSSMYKAIDYLAAYEQRNVEGTENVLTFTGYNTGNYAQYKGMKTYSDARAEAGMNKINGKADTLKEYYNLTRGILSPKKFIEKYRFDFMLVENLVDPELYWYLDSDEGYMKVYDVGGYSIFFRK